MNSARRVLAARSCSVLACSVLACSVLATALLTACSDDDPVPPRAEAPVSTAPTSGQKPAPITVTVTETPGADGSGSGGSGSGSGGTEAEAPDRPAHSGDSRYGDCTTTVLDHRDVDHPRLGRMRIFLTQGSERRCVVATRYSDGGNAFLTRLDGTHTFRFASPATDATGNTFIDYNPGRYDGVFVLIPTDDGYVEPEEGSNDFQSDDRVRYYSARTVGPGTDGRYQILSEVNDCEPSCADGTTHRKVLSWNGRSYS